MSAAFTAKRALGVRRLELFETAKRTGYGNLATGLWRLAGHFLEALVV
jgi:hypothetical protein